VFVKEPGKGDDMVFAIIKGGTGEADLAIEKRK